MAPQILGTLPQGGVVKFENRTKDGLFNPNSQHQAGFAAPKRFSVCPNNKCLRLNHLKATEPAGSPCRNCKTPTLPITFDFDVSWTPQEGWKMTMLCEHPATPDQYMGNWKATAAHGPPHRPTDTMEQEFIRQVVLKADRFFHALLTGNPAALGPQSKQA